MKKVYDLHHLLPRSQNGTNAKHNLARVPQDKQRMWHGLWRNMLPPDIAQEMNKTWISPHWRMVAFEAKPQAKRQKKTVIYEDDECIVYLKEK